MKYIILREHAGDGQLIPVFTVAPFTHKELAAGFVRTHTAVSAGFCAPDAGGKFRTYGRSESLCLAPAVGDDQLITAFVKATLTFNPEPVV